MLLNNRRSLKTYPTVDLPKLSHSELGQLVLLGRLMEDDNKILLTVEAMAAALSQTVNRTYVFIRKMIKIGVMKRRGRDLHINPLYLFVGKRISCDLYLLFQESLDEILPDWVKKEFKELTKND